MTMKAVLMMAYGAPDSLSDVPLFLRNVRHDEIPPPSLVEKYIARYRAIGGKSPLLDITKEQAAVLERYLTQTSTRDDFRVFIAMRHWRPSFEDALLQIHASNIRQIYALCMTPFSSPMSSDVYFNRLDQAIRVMQDQGKITDIQIIPLQRWYSNSIFIQSIVPRVKQVMDQIPARETLKSKIIFTAHSLPVAGSIESDPYHAQILETAHLVSQRLDLQREQWMLCYQSIPDRPGNWLGPSLAETIANLKSENIGGIIVIPIGFLADNIETLYDLDIEARQLAEGNAMNYYRSQCLNSDPTFITALADIVYSERKL